MKIAICKKSYPEEDDMVSYYEETLNCDEVTVYERGTVHEVHEKKETCALWKVLELKRGMYGVSVINHDLDQLQAAQAAILLGESVFYDAFLESMSPEEALAIIEENENYWATI